ncbi:aminotransferase class V-fold PLP-dependent enzyme [Acidisoma cellulosilytica]|uniref:Cysteine desulfurase n=1 Tax=Acidisoma cellulosilyticum TaxID=2802395 RepID=A0A964E3R3_9PROT|nr:aminotransferase class V-fold PLP-dependent enzyme [Acidisoma cellulosilyticum]MCB8880218.1 aminotransferase class V-fold PLP-dependent enzyme [Acidisoma cellulosilyticum]
MAASSRVYLDANATEPLRSEARAAVMAALDTLGNPSSIHGDGRAARKILEDAREAIATRFGGSARNLVFASGGTEANAIAIHGLARGGRVLRGATEHAAVIAAAGDGAAILPVDRDGRVMLDVLVAALAHEKPALVSVMLANNETGTIQPLAEIASLCRAAGVLFHVDAVQGAGRLPVDFSASGADCMTLSAHKLGGPPGAGALLLTPAAAALLQPLVLGGGQERGRRGGTHALPNIAGFAAAAVTCRADESARLAPLRDAMEAAALAAGATVIGASAARLPNTTCLALPGVRAESQVIALDLAGISVSAGAACSSGKVARSHVLEAMGLGDLSAQAIRVSLPWNATEADAAAFIAAYQAMAARMLRHAAA